MRVKYRGKHGAVISLVYDRFYDALAPSETPGELVRRCRAHGLSRPAIARVLSARTGLRPPSTSAIDYWERVAP